MKSLKIKKIGKKDVRYTVRFPDGELFSNIRFTTKKSANQYIKKVEKLKRWSDGIQNKNQK